MSGLAAIERELDAIPGGEASAQRLLALSEQVLEAWIAARGDAPTREEREGFRLLALHHQGARGVPSFNACRETCREIAYHYNVLVPKPPQDARQRATMMAMLVRHLVLFVSGKLAEEKLGEFCCASKPLRRESSTMPALSEETRNA